eukprot:scaffold3882_cov74-Skeletonema_menzelii.AAC.1
MEQRLLLLQKVVAGEGCCYRRPWCYLVNQSSFRKWEESGKEKREQHRTLNARLRVQGEIGQISQVDMGQV